MAKAFRPLRKYCLQIIDHEHEYRKEVQEFLQHHKQGVHMDKDRESVHSGKLKWLLFLK